MKDYEHVIRYANGEILPRKALSLKQRRILAFLRQFREEKDYPPTIRDIVRGCGISSTSVVDYNLNVLEREGYIRRDREVSRGIEVLDRERSRVVRVPLIGCIAAGEPMPVPTSDTWELEPLETIEVSSDLTRDRDWVYALRVKGTSMIDALISDGDIVIMQQANTAGDGDMVAAWLKNEGEITLKKLYREADRVRLQPANSQMKPIFTEAGNVEVQGRVVGVIRHIQ
ncbi:MAG: repressor LexA [Dehalococcoidia bacterium]|nr:repressor LexA [Dehalococcoidia bacterium]